jgi:O-methyltransferase involved in polyketide biosynthesis
VTPRRQVRLGDVQQTLLIPLYGRAVESARPGAVLRDPRAEEMVAAIDYDFDRFAGVPSLTGAVLRTVLFDHWVRAFLHENPSGTVVELGTGLNTRYERLDNGHVHWFDLDLPDVIALRRSFFTDTARRRTIAASVVDGTWLEAVAEAPAPYFFAAEAVLPFLEETDVRHAVDRLAENFPGARLALDTAGPGIIDAQDEHDALSKVTARMRWSCADPAALQEWRPGVRLLESCRLTTLPAAVHSALPVEYRDMLAAVAEQRLPQMEEYRLSLFHLG